MDAIKDQLENVRRQLAGLNGSQRMLVGTLVAVMAVTVLYWGRYAGTAEMVPVLEQTLTEDEIGPINARLAADGIPHSVVGGKVLVPADRKAEILANLMYAHELPSDTHFAFEEMTAKELTPFSSETTQSAVYNHATERELTGVIRRWPGVANARVVINAKNEVHIGQSTPPTAMVDITTKGRAAGDPDAVRQLVQSAADGVAGAVSGMQPRNVKVIVDGHSQRVDDAGSVAAGGGLPGSDLLEQQQKHEAFLEQKIHNQFPFIAGMTVNVTCDVENASRVDNVTKFDQTGAFSKPNYEQSHSVETHGTDGTGPEVGAASNTGTANAGGGTFGGGGDVSAAPIASSAPAGGTSSTTTDETTGSTTWVPQTLSVVNTPAGKALVKSASICIPMSYVAREAKAATPGGRDPSPADLQRMAGVQTAKIRSIVAHSIGLASADAVSVETFTDDGGAAADLTLAAATAPATSAISAHAKEIAVGTLAAVSLFVMVQMARKGGGATLPSPAMAGFNGLSAAALGGHDDDDGEDDDDHRSRDDIAQTSGLMGGMAGVELDEETLRTQQMLDQVSTLVKEDPDAAAQLVKRWVTRA